MKIANIAEQYLAHKRADVDKGNIRDTTFQTIAHCINHFARDMGDLDDADLNHEILDDWTIEQLQRYARTTIDSRLRMLGNMFKWAERERLIYTPPHVEGLKNVKPIEKEPVSWEGAIKQIAHVQGYNEIYAAYYVFMLYTGIRPSEAAQLIWKDYFRKLAVIKIGYRKGFALKNTQSRREVPVSEVPADALTWLHRVTEGRIDKPIFPFAQSANTHLQYCKRRKDNPISLTIGDLRSIFSTELMRRGTPTLQIQAIMGHKPNSAVTADHYLTSRVALAYEAAKQLGDVEYDRPELCVSA